MSKQDALSLEELTKPQPESRDQAYLCWKEVKVLASLKEVEAHPESVMAAKDVWASFGLER